MGKLIVRRKGYSRKAYTRTTKTGKRVRVKKSRVPPTKFKIKDRGKKGRGKKVIPTPLRKGSLGVDFNKPSNIRRRQETKLAKRIGEKKVVGKLRAVQVFNKRTNPTLSAKAKSDARYIAGSFIGKKKVRSGTGFRRKQK